MGLETYEGGGLVYFVSWRQTEAPVKVGRVGGDSIEARLRHLQCGNPNELVVLGWFEGGVDLEAYLHHELRDTRVRGEWFRASHKLHSLIALSTSEYNHFSEGFGSYGLASFVSTKPVCLEPSNESLAHE